MKDCLTNIVDSEYPVEYTKFVEFSQLKIKGLRKQEFISLDSFISQVEVCGFELQKNFIIGLLEILELYHDTHHVLVHPLEQRLIKPVCFTSHI